MSERNKRGLSGYREVVSDRERDDILAAVVDVLIRLDDDGVVQSVTEARHSTLGYRTEQLAGRTLSSLLASESTPMQGSDVDSPEALEEMLLDAETEAVTAPLEAADGRVVTVSFRTVPGRDDGGTVCLGHEVTVDVQEQGPRDGVMDNIADPLYVLDAVDRFEQVNEAFVEYTGYEREELLGRDISEILPRSDYQRASVELQKLVDQDERESTTFETTFITKGGEQILTEAHATALTDEDGTYAGSVGVLRDIRERKHRERNLDLLKQVLTRVFRHNVRNSLNIATGHAELLDSAVNEGLQEHTEQILETLDELLSHTEKARLIETVMQRDELFEIDLVEKVTSVAEAAREEYPDATIDVEMPATAVVRAHPNLSKAIEELIENGIEHAPDDSPAHVEIWFDEQEGNNTLFVEDESGGLADHEIDVLERGEESDLEHSSGVGLWLIRWLVEYSNAKMIVHRTAKGSLMGIRFGQQPDSEPRDGNDKSPLARTPAHIREISPKRFRGDTVIGRVEALGQLKDIYDSLQRSGGQAVLVTGEAGVGKTTLVEQFRDHVAMKEEPVVGRGYCESGAQPSYHAFREVMAEVPGERNISEILADAADLSAEDADELEQRKRTLFADIADELRAVATEHPVVLFVEDMHWADQGTIELFEYLVEEVGRWGHPVLFLGTYRKSDIDGGHDVLEIADDTADAGRGTVIELEPFGQDNLESLLSYMLDIEELPDSFVEAVYEHTGGTPLFVNELGRHFVETLGPVQSRTDLPESLDGVAVPETVESAITERIEVLPEDIRPVVRLGAVIGREFSFDLLREASDRSIETLVQECNSLIQRQVWKRSDAGIEFVHGVMRETILDRLSSEERTRLHTAAAEAIQSVYPDAIDDRAGQIAHHYEVAGDTELAVRFYRRAGERARDLYAYDEAVAAFQQALAMGKEANLDDKKLATIAASLADMHQVMGAFDEARERAEAGLETAPDRSQERCELLGTLARARHAQSEWNRARETTDQQRELAIEIESKGFEAEALNLLGKATFELGNPDRAFEYTEQSLAIAREIEDLRKEYTALTALGSITIFRGEFDRSHEYLEESLEIARELGDSEGEAENLNNLGLAAVRRGEYDQGREYYEEALAIYREIGHIAGEAKILNNLGWVASMQGAYDPAGEYLQESLSAFREVGNPKGQGASLNSLGIAAIGQGEYDQAREHLKKSLAIFRDIGDRKGVGRSLVNLGTVAHDQGEYEQAREYLKESLAIYRDIGDRTAEGESLATLAAVERHQGEYERAREYVEETLLLARDIGDYESEAEGLIQRGRLAHRRGDHKDAEEAFESALEIVRGQGYDRRELRSLLGLAALARDGDDYGQASDYLETSRAVFEEGEHPFESARITLERARLALARGDTDTASERAERAYEVFADLGASHYAARGRHLQGRIAAESGDTESTREHWRTAVSTFETVASPQDALRTLEGLVETCRDIGDDDQAKNWRRRARETLSAAPDQVVEHHGAWVRE
jgi:PAS domain S-box-containing protein